jgi:hypothetical protein
VLAKNSRLTSNERYVISRQEIGKALEILAFI